MYTYTYGYTFINLTVLYASNYICVCVCMYVKWPSLTAGAQTQFCLEPRNVSPPQFQSINCQIWSVWV